MTSKRLSDADWLEEAARYFENRSTGGEDMAFWANAANAERCRSIAAFLRSAREAEPVAWLVELSDGMRFASIGHEQPTHITTSVGVTLKTLRPLYLHPSPSTEAQCCMCGKKGLSTVEGGGGTECQLEDGRWTCSRDCYYTAVDWFSRPSTEGLGVRVNREAALKRLDDLAGMKNIPSVLTRAGREFIADAVIRSALSTSAEQVEISDEMVALSADLRRYNDWLMSIRIPGHEITALQAGNAMLKAATALSPIPDNQVKG